MNEKYKQHKKLCNGLNKLYISKNKEYVDRLEETERGSGGFGSTGR